MFKKWMGLALLAGWLGQGTVATAQYLPGMPAPAAMPEPLPCPPTNPLPTNLVPGPISPLVAPKGPGDDLSLPAGIRGAFQCEEYATPCHVYFHMGAIALKRQDLGNGVVAFTDSSVLVPTETGAQTFVTNFAPALDANTLSPDMTFGGRATLGWLSEEFGCALEMSGFFIPLSDTFTEAVSPTRLNTFFINTPRGFSGGDDGIFRQVDRVRATQDTSLGSAEINVRTFSKIFTGCEPLFGVRYFYHLERFSILTDDDSIANADPFGRGVPLRVATYSSRVRSNFIAPQFGLEYQHDLLPGLAVGLYGKAAAGVSFSDIEITLDRADGRRGVTGTRQRRQFSQVYDVGLFFDGYILERLRVRAGYQALWLNHVPEAVDQVSFDLSQPLGRQDNTANIFYHGPSIELQFLF